jgi:hypothetical protein
LLCLLAKINVVRVAGIDFARRCCIQKEAALKTWVLPLALLTLCLGATSAVAQNDLYDNGPTNGQDLGWTISFGSAVSDQFILNTDVKVDAIDFAAWLLPGDVLETAEVSITSSEFGGTSYFDQTVKFTASGCFSNAARHNVCNETGTSIVNLNAGSYWLNLSNGVVNTSDPVYWDMNSGPSLASESSLGTIPSESFSILGGSGGTSTTGTTPEPGGIMLFGSGVLGVAGVLRRKLF